MLKNKYVYSVGSTPMGTSLDIVSYEIDSEKEGKHIYIQSGIHGGEITQWIIHELFSYIENNLDNGKVTLVPCANPVSWTQRIYFSTNGKFDLYMGKDWNRNFPGNSEGSLGERIADVLLKNAEKSDFAIDLHTSRKSIPFGIYSKEEYKKYIKIIGVEYNQYIDMETKTSYANTFNACLDKKGIPNLCIECGSHDAFEAEYVKKVFEGIKRLLSSFGMVKDQTIEKAPQRIKTFAKTVKYTSPKGCLIKINKELGEKINKGDALFSCYDNNELGKEEVIKSDVEGVLFKESPTHIYWSGDDVVQIILSEGIEELETE